MEQQIEDLQTRLSFLEDSVDALTKTQVEMQNSMYEVQHMLQHVQEQLQQLAPSNIDAGTDQKPPHY
jgi:uncharacterized coiled-coil protein SlyX